jgi:hypothetical protein
MVTGWFPGNASLKNSSLEYSSPDYFLPDYFPIKFVSLGGKISSRTQKNIVWGRKLVSR